MGTRGRKRITKEKIIKLLPRLNAKELEEIKSRINLLSLGNERESDNPDLFLFCLKSLFRSDKEVEGI